MVRIARREGLQSPSFLLVNEEQVPPNKVVVMPDRQAPVYSKIVSEVSEERFEPVGIGGYCGVVNIFEHIGQGASDVGVGSPDVIMRVIDLSGFPVERLVHEELLEVLMPSVELTDPIQTVVVRADVADLTDEPTELDACGASGMSGKPCQALALDVNDAALSWDLRTGISNGPREAVRAIRSKAGYPDAELLEEFQIADDLVLILFRGKAVMDRGLAVRIPIDDQAAALPEPDPVGEQMNGPTVRDHARRRLLETFGEPTAQLALAVSGSGGDVLYRLLSEHPFAEPCGPVR